MLIRRYYTESDIKVFYYYNDEPKDIKTKNYLDKIFIGEATYTIVFLISGDRIFEIGNERITASDGAVAIEGPNKRLGFERISNRTNCYIQISLQQKFFDNIVGDENFLRIFHNSNGKNKVFYPAEFPTPTCFDMLNSIFDILDKHLGRVHLVSKILSIISELDMEYDRTDKNFNGADNFNINIIGYMEKHFTEKLTIESLCKIFFVSRTTLNSILKKYTGHTFLKHLNLLRTKEANKLIINTNYSLKNICNLCGFTDYSTFFRAYKSVYGVSPQTHLMEKTKNSKKNK